MAFFKQTFLSLYALRFPEIYIVALFFAGAGWYSMSDYLFYTPDSARYVIWSNSLASGDGFSDYTSPEPKKYVIHAPLYSVVMAPAAFFFENNIIAIKAGTVILAVILLFVFHGYMLSRSGRWAALFAAAVLAFHPLTLVYSTQPLSEILFALSFIALLAVLDKWVSTGYVRNRLLAGVVISLLACILSREIGMILLLAVVLYVAMQKQYEKAAIIFMSVIIVYSLWLFRNELLIAGQEQPELRNMTLIVSHILTSHEQSLFLEFYTRMMVNGEFYIQQLHSLIFYSQFTPSGAYESSIMPVVDRTSVYIVAAQQAVSIIFPLLAAFPLVLLAAGIIKERTNKHFLFIYIFFLPLYLCLLMIYPVYDIRFLYPLLLMLILLAGIGFGELLLRKNSYITAALIICSLAALIPNVLWGLSYIEEGNTYHSDQLEYFNELKKHPEKLTSLNKPFGKAAEWITSRNDSSEVIISRWKELGLYLQNKKIFLMESFTPIASFEQTIRDYGVRYIVTTKNDYDWHEYEFQMNLSRRYSFVLVHSVADFDIYEVKNVTKENPKRVDTHQAYQFLFYHLGRGNYDTLMTFFRSNEEIVNANPSLRFYRGVTRECAGDLDTALIEFEELYRLPQGISMSQQIGFHKNVIDKRKAALRSLNAQERSALTFNVALNYWELDLRQSAFDFLERTLVIDSMYMPAYSLKIYFSLVNQDTASAKTTFTYAAKQFPSEPVIFVFSELFSRFDSLTKAGTYKRTAELYRRAANDYQLLGLSESSLEGLWYAHMLDRSNIVYSIALASLFEKKSKYYPALKILEYTNSVNSDKNIQKRIEELKRRY